MYLTANDNTEILLRTIHDLDELIAAKQLEPSAAWAILSKTSQHHPDHPKKQEEKAAKRKEIVEAATGAVPEDVTI